MKVLLVQPYLSGLKIMHEMLENKILAKSNIKKFIIPLGLLHIGSVLEHSGVEVKIIDLDRDFFYYVRNQKIKEKNISGFLNSTLLKETKEFKPDIIGITGNFNINASFVEKCCEEIKEFKDITIVLGGHFYTNTYKETLTYNKNVDYIVLGEGEYAMLDIVKNNSSLEAHPNIASRNNTDLKSAAIIENLDELPNLNYELLGDLEDYLSSAQDIKLLIPRENVKAFSIMTSRGCPHQCIYCASHKVHGRKIRAFSLGKVINLLKTAVTKYGINTIIFEDDFLTFNKKRTIELCKEICKNFGDRFFLYFPNSLSPKTLDEETIYWLVKAGMKEIQLAVESGSQYVQNNIIKRKLDLKSINPVINCLKKHDIIIRVTFIIGFPGETLEMMRETKNFAKEIEVDWSVFFLAIPIVGSELYEMARRNQQIVGSLDDASSFNAQLQTTDWTADELAQMWQEANYEVNFLENYNFKVGNFKKSYNIFKDIIDNYPNHLLGNYCFWKAQIGIRDFEGAEKTRLTLMHLIEQKDNINILQKYNLLDKEPFAELLDSLINKT